MAKKAIITGSAGFVGQHLATHLLEEGYEVKGFNLRDGQDIRNFEFVRNMLDVERPNYIFHLAGQAFVPESFSNPVRTFEVNTIGSLNILEAVRQLQIKTKIQLCGTSEEYGGAMNGEGIVDEETQLEPSSPYAVSKMAMDYLGQVYARAYGLEVVTTRAFNHAGPGRGEMYAESAFAKQIVECELGKRDVVKHGNLNSIRNYTDVRDVVRAYKLAIDLPPGVYNICSDNSVTMQELMDLLVKNAKVEIKTEVDQALFRPGDFSFKTPSCEKLKKLTGWKTTYSLEDTMISVLEGWREKLK
jgi:GDP-4-dehydro-6-deoxy-D-mannose reductase